MTRLPPAPPPDRTESALAITVFVVCLLFNCWGEKVGWRSLNLPGHEFRQAQTALPAYYLKQDRDYSLAYPTPVLGKPWSIALEFPLYQWTVVAVGDATGLGLVKSGRAVSIACFYLMLPALFLLLGNLGVAPGRRWLVMALVVTSPLYIFYARAFLIETMALMLSLWFWVAFERTVARADWRWLVLANLAGAAAGMVKVTTLVIYLLPPALWALRRLWAGRRGGEWRRDLPWMIAAVALPLAATAWWEHFADGIRQLNPLAHFLTSENLLSFTFGTWATRLSPELWAAKWHSTAYAVTCWPALVIGVATAVVWRRRWRESLFCVGWFLTVLVVFPVLYGFHDYYFVANGVLLLSALGLALVGWAESGRWGARWMPALLALLLAGGQAGQYRLTYYEMQSGVSRGGNGLTESLRGLLKADEVIVFVGQQWNPMLPYYAQRRAMMIREEEERNPARLDAAFAALAGEKIGAVVISDPVQHPAALLKRTAAFGIVSQPIYRWHDVTVYLRGDHQEASIRKIQQAGFGEVTWVPGVEPKPERLAGEWVEVAGLSPAQRDLFVGMNPRPVRFFSSFGPAAWYKGGRADYGAHPVTRLVFAVPAGEHRLRTSVNMPAETYEPSQLPDRMTDGVEITLKALGAEGREEVLFTRLINPRDNPGDRGLCALDMPFRLARAGEVELFFGPGPAGRNTHDTIIMGQLEIQ